MLSGLREKIKKLLEGQQPGGYVSPGGSIIGTQANEQVPGLVEVPVPSPKIEYDHPMGLGALPLSPEEQAELDSLLHKGSWTEAERNRMSELLRRPQQTTTDVKVILSGKGVPFG